MSIYFHTLNVLVVDDDENQRTFMRVYLMKLGVKNFVFAEDGEEALKALHGELFHVVLTDNEMPIMNGPNLVTNIRADKILCHLKVAMISGNIGVEGDGALVKFLKEHGVLPVPKSGFTGDVLREVLITLTKEP